MKRTPLRPGSPPVRKTPLRNTPFARFQQQAVAMAEHWDANDRARRKAVRAQIQRVERFGTYAWLIRAMPCAGCYPTMYKGRLNILKTAEAFAEFTLKRHMRQSEAAHLKSVGAGGLADGNLLPLCSKCHRLGPKALHNVPASDFATRIGIPLAITAKEIANTPAGKVLLSIDRRAVKALRDLAANPLAPGAWHVTGGGSAGGQTVNRNPGYQPCTCDFHKAHPAKKCKHQIAVRLYEGARLDTVLREVVAAEVGL